jgi:hypothetical protein
LSNYLLTFKRKDGKLIDVLLHWVPINPENFDDGIIFTAADISAMIRVEKELRNSLDETPPIIISILFYIQSQRV